MPTHDPWDGTGWDITAPDIEQPHGNDYKEIYDLRKGVAIRANKEHVTYAGSSAGGEHKNGSAVAYEGTSTPTNRPDGTTALANNAIDRGRIWIDDNYDLPVLKRWTGAAFETLAAHLVHATSCVFELENLEDANTDGAMDSIIKFVGFKDAAGDCDLAWLKVSHDGTADDQKGKVEILVNDGDDDNTPSKTGIAIGSDQLVELPGALSVTGNVSVNTNKFTVAGATGNTVVAGTLGVTGVATLGDGSANATSAAPTADAQLANKKYVDDSIAAEAALRAFSAYTTQDSDAATLVKDHAYLAASDGFVVARASLNNTQYLRAYVDTDTNPPSGGMLVGAVYASQTAEVHTIRAEVANGEYFEVVCTGTMQQIYWKSVGTLNKPVDQD